MPALPEPSPPGPPAPPDPARAEVEPPAEPSAPTAARQPLLMGRVSFAAPAPLALRPVELFDRPDERQHYDAYEVTVDGCALSLALVSAGLVRPAGELALPEGAERRLLREGTPSALEVIAWPHRELETLGAVHHGPGAVVFEADGTAIDVHVWALAGEMTPDDTDDERWRRSPDAVACLEPARRLRDVVVGTLSVERPYASADTLGFGWDEDADAPARYRGVVPAGWTISTGVAFDAGFEHVHRRLPWSERAASEPMPAAKLWTFTDSPVELDQLAPPSPVRRELFGRMLAFDGTGCASELLPDVGLVQYLCLTGTPAQQGEILAVLASFVPVDGRPHPPAALGPCTGIVQDETPLSVRDRPRPGGAVVGELTDGTEVVLLGRSGSWGRIERPAGWVHGSRVSVGACAAHLPDETATAR